MSNITEFRRAIPPAGAESSSSVIGATSQSADVGQGADALADHFIQRILQILDPQLAQSRDPWAFQGSRDYLKALRIYNRIVKPLWEEVRK